MSLNKEILQKEMRKIEQTTKEKMIELMVLELVKKCETKCSRCLGFYCLFEYYRNTARIEEE